LVEGVVVQINGMVVPGLEARTFSHFGDPWPYLPAAWGRWYDPGLALLRRRAQRRALVRAAGVGYTSAWFRDLLARRHRLPPRGVVLHNGVPESWVRSAADSPPVPGRRRQIVSLSNVSPYKGQAQVIRALPQLPGVRYVIAGYCDDAYRAELDELIRQQGVADRVELPGRVSDEEARKLLEQSRVFALPSVCESFGIGAIEAMSRGCPVVAARAAAVPEVCGDAATLVEPGDDEGLVGALRQVLDDDAHAAAMRERGIANVARFTWEQTAAKLAASLEQMVTALPAAAGCRRR
jgi:glycosyltransferase involved in cell wall biosynthesis